MKPKLLIVTQVVDSKHPGLGFMTRWIAALASRLDEITVISLQVGEYDLPANVRVLSLGKERGFSRLKYLWRFYRHLWQERRNYQDVFVHMNQEYVLLAGWLWRLSGKKILLWRNHPIGNWLTRLAVLLSHRVFCTSPLAFTARFAKTEIMPVGIDTDQFKPEENLHRSARSILFLGRISPIKRVENFIQALVELHQQGEVFSADIIGNYLPDDRSYFDKLKQAVMRSGLVDLVQFRPAVTSPETPKLYNCFELYVNCTPAGSRDKTIFEAMACGLPVVVENELAGSDLAEAIRQVLNLPAPAKLALGQKNRQIVLAEHSLDLLINRLCSRF